MTSIVLHPALVFVVSVLGLWVAAISGAFLNKGRSFSEGMRHEFGIILAATLTLLGLLIGFSFSMAANRYDQRKNLEAAEANAIGTELLRADLLGAGDAAKLRDLLQKYVELRMRFYVADERDVRDVDAQTKQLQKELWSAVLTPAFQQQGPLAALAVSGMNEVINAQGYIQAAWWNRIPVAAWVFMALIAVCANMLVGYGLRTFKPRSPFLLILPVLVALAFLLIDDIDTPRHGLIKVVPKDLTSLLGSLKPPEETVRRR
jgi:NADH:ubiquinone oxidoreductase subunit 6 (subunit J)